MINFSICIPKHPLSVIFNWNRYFLITCCLELLGNGEHSLRRLRCWHQLASLNRTPRHAGKTVDFDDVLTRVEFTTQRLWVELHADPHRVTRCEVHWQNFSTRGLCSTAPSVFLWGSTASQSLKFLMEMCCDSCSPPTVLIKRKNDNSYWFDVHPCCKKRL